MIMIFFKIAGWFSAIVYFLNLFSWKCFKLQPKTKS